MEDRFFAVLRSLVKSTNEVRLVDALVVCPNVINAYTFCWWDRTYYGRLQA